LDPHIFADPDSGSQNLADPMDPDPKHCISTTRRKKIEFPTVLRIQISWSRQNFGFQDPDPQKNMRIHGSKYQPKTEKILFYSLYPNLNY